ncbi:helix-turn-helix transcriptional regulator [Salinicola salarius]|uniref:helix-turn-helix transcriptional regulator n=1 Tax=Salinicola salarius TaxID=430457 RepID=UPI000B3FAA0E|nr:AlpA family phage regulatory protein [Salinicola salarius]
MSQPDTPTTPVVFLTARQVSQRESVSVGTIWRWAREDKFPTPVKLGDNCTRWRLADLEAWEAERGEVA